MAGEPNDPRGPGTPPPLDPGVASQFAGMEDKLRDANAMADSAKKYADEAERASNEVDKLGRGVKKQVDAYKEFLRLTKRKATDDTISRKELERVVALGHESLKTMKASSTVYRQVAASIKDMEKFMKKVPAGAELLKEQLTEARGLLKDMAVNANAVAKALGELGRTGASLRGMAGIFESLGLGKHATNIDRRLEKMENVKQAVADSKELRQAATTKHMKEKRAKSIEELGAAQKKGAGWVDPETGSVMDFIDQKGGLTSGGRKALAGKMGFKPGTDKYTEFLGGEESMAGGGEAGAGWAGAMSEGGGAMEALSTTMEGAVGALMELAPEIAILIEVLKILNEIFGSYVKQNKEMEKSIGKGGLFTQQGIGAGDAFSAARNALTPGGGKFGAGTFLGAGLGINWERNLAMAGQLSDSGMAAFPGMMGADVANQRPGAMGEFMQGGVGEMQRIVMGAGRVGGLDDKEGIGEVIKLLGEYRETIASSEDFMAQLNKDTAAAGISTTKYLKIIDEVNGAFDKMSKSLDQVTGVMRELSRYGSISSETLKDMMDFLSKGQAKTDMGNLQTAVYTEMVKPKDILEAQRNAQRSTLSNYVDEYNEEAAAHHMGQMSTAGMQKAISSGNFEQAQSMANAMRDEIDRIGDPTVSGPMTDALTKVQDQINRVRGVMSNDPAKRASSAALYGMSETDKISSLMTNLRESAGKSGLSFKDIMAGGGGFEGQTMFQMLAKQLGIEDSPAKISQILRRVGENRVKDIDKDTPDDRKKNAKILFNEFYKGAHTKDGLGVYLKEHGMGQYLKGTYDETIEGMATTDDGLKALHVLFGENLDAISASQASQDKLVEESGKGHKQDAKGLADQLSIARNAAMRTQTVEEILANTFKPLLIKLVHGIEAILSAVSKMLFSDVFGGKESDVNSEKTQQEQAKDLDESIGVLTRNIDKGTKEQRAMEDAHLKDGKWDTAANKLQAQQLAMQNATGLKTLSDMQAAQTSGVIDDSVMALVKQANSGGMGTTPSGVTINQFYSSNSTLDVQQANSPGTSATEVPKNQKGASQGNARGKQQ